MFPNFWTENDHLLQMFAWGRQTGKTARAIEAFEQARNFYGPRSSAFITGAAHMADSIRQKTGYRPWTQVIDPNRDLYIFDEAESTETAHSISMIINRGGRVAVWLTPRTNTLFPLWQLALQNGGAYRPLLEPQTLLERIPYLGLLNNYGFYAETFGFFPQEIRKMFPDGKKA